MNVMQIIKMQVNDISHPIHKPGFHYLLLSFFLTFVTAFAFAQESAPNATPSLLLGQGDQLPRVKAEIAAGNPVFVAALGEIVEEADEALGQPMVNVVDEGALPPSGDPHDYYSYSPYWWPDPENPDGPYIWRDGETNPDRSTSDVSRIEAMVDRVTSLVPAWYFTGDERYAESAVEQLRAWFLDPETKMNPNVDFGQKRRGHSYNSPSGVLEAWRMHWVIDCAILLESFPGWTAEDAKALRGWFSQFATWMVDSPTGIEESMQPNNHGSWYNAQLILYALYGENFDLARKQLDGMPARIFSQVFIDGRQPQELIRTRSLNYSIYNARALITVARLGRHLDYDLFAYRSLEGRSIRLAVDYMTPFILGEQEWPIAQTSRISSSIAHRSITRSTTGRLVNLVCSTTHSEISSPAPSSFFQNLGLQNVVPCSQDLSKQLRSIAFLVPTAQKKRELQYAALASVILVMNDISRSREH